MTYGYRTKAERIYHMNRVSIENQLAECDLFNAEHFDAINIHEYDETVITKRTFNDMVKIHHSVIENLKLDYKLGIIGKEQVEKELEVIRIMKNSLHNLKDAYGF